MKLEMSVPTWLKKGEVRGALIAVVVLLLLQFGQRELRTLNFLADWIGPRMEIIEKAKGMEELGKRVDGLYQKMDEAFRRIDEGEKGRASLETSVRNVEGHLREVLDWQAHRP